MGLKITIQEMERRKLIADARLAITEAMEPFGQGTSPSEGLTPLEWLDVFATIQGRMIGHGLREEWDALEDIGE